MKRRQWGVMIEDCTAPFAELRLVQSRAGGGVQMHRCTILHNYATTNLTLVPGLAMGEPTPRVLGRQLPLPSPPPPRGLRPTVIWGGSWHPEPRSQLPHGVGTLFAVVCVPLCHSCLPFLTIDIILKVLPSPH